MKTTWSSKWASKWRKTFGCCEHGGIFTSSQSPLRSRKKYQEGKNIYRAEGGKCLFDVRGQRSEWSDWLETMKMQQWLKWPLAKALQRGISDQQPHHLQPWSSVSKNSPALYWIPVTSLIQWTCSCKELTTLSLFNHNMNMLKVPQLSPEATAGVRNVRRPSGTSQSKGLTSGWLSHHPICWWREKSLQRNVATERFTAGKVIQPTVYRFSTITKLTAPPWAYL